MNELVSERMPRVGIFWGRSFITYEKLKKIPHFKKKLIF